MVLSTSANERKNRLVRRDIIVGGASVGGVGSLTAMIAGLPADLDAAVLERALSSALRAVEENARTGQAVLDWKEKHGEPDAPHFRRRIEHLEEEAKTLRKLLRQTTETGKMLWKPSSPTRDQ
jgi:hypothetical protein